MGRASIHVKSLHIKVSVCGRFHASLPGTIYIPVMSPHNVEFLVEGILPSLLLSIASMFRGPVLAITGSMAQGMSM